MLPITKSLTFGEILKRAIDAHVRTGNLRNALAVMNEHCATPIDEEHYLRMAANRRYLK